MVQPTCMSSCHVRFLSGSEGVVDLSQCGPFGDTMYDKISNVTLRLAPPTCLCLALPCFFFFSCVAGTFFFFFFFPSHVCRYLLAACLSVSAVFLHYLVISYLCLAACYLPSCSLFIVFTSSCLTARFTSSLPYLLSSWRFLPCLLTTYTIPVCLIFLPLYSHPVLQISAYMIVCATILYLCLFLDLCSCPRSMYLCFISYINTKTQYLYLYLIFMPPSRTCHCIPYLSLHPISAYISCPGILYSRSYALLRTLE